MRVKECLDRADQLNRLIPAFERRILDYREALDISTPATDAEHVSHTRNVDAMGEQVAALVDAEKELDSMRAERDRLKATFMRWISLLTDHHEVVYMSERYIRDSPNKQIAQEHGRTLRSVQMVLQSARKHLEERVSDAL